MGLDVYLKKATNFDAHLAYEKRKELAHERCWAGAKYDAMSQAEKDAAQAKCNAWDKAHPPAPHEAEPEDVQEDSKVHPDHMFKIGYLRSSYNSGGVNSVVGNAIGKDLYFVFFGSREDEQREYYIKPDWAACLARARELRDEFARDCEVNGGYLVRRVALNQFVSADNIKARDERSAMSLFKVERAKHVDRLAKIAAEGKKPDMWDSGSYSNGLGEFSLGEPLRVAAVIPGLEDNVILRVRGEAQTLAPCTYVIYEASKVGDGERPMEWYQSALEITAEMCEWVLAQPDVESYRIAWSS